MEFFGKKKRLHLFDNFFHKVEIIQCLPNVYLKFSSYLIWLKYKQQVYIWCGQLNKSNYFVVNNIENLGNVR